MRPGAFALLIELIPRSDKARLIDFVKFKGTVDGSRRSKVCQMRHHSEKGKAEKTMRIESQSRALTSSQFVHFNFVSSGSSIESGQSSNWTGSDDHCLLTLSCHGLLNAECESLGIGQTLAGHKEMVPAHCGSFAAGTRLLGANPKLVMRNPHSNTSGGNLMTTF